MDSEQVYESKCYHDIAIGVIKRFLEGFHIGRIDKVNYYNARREYYKLKIGESYGREKRWFEGRIKGCEEILREFGVKITGKKLEFQFI